MEAEFKAWERRRGTTEVQTHRAEDDRSPFDRDRARIIHSAAFRRLQAKTQVLGINEGDFHRTRLTHSMEVAQVASGIAGRLKKDDRHKEFLGSDVRWVPPRELIEAICFAHDLGHPPFGHAGERALNNALLTSPNAGPDTIGFEGNGQTLRLLTQLEAHTKGHGLDLTRRTLLGVLKYPVPFSAAVKKELPDKRLPLLQIKWPGWKPPKCYLDTEAGWVDWILEPFGVEERAEFTRCEDRGPKEHSKPVYKSLDCSIMDIADEIAYGVHDFEDGIALDLISWRDWEKDIAPHWDPEWANSVGLNPDGMEVGKQFFLDGPDASGARKRTIGGLVNAFIGSVQLKRLRQFSHPLLELNAELSEPAEALRRKLQDVNFKRMIKTPSVQTLEYRGQVNVLALFRAIESDPTIFLSGDFLARVPSDPSDPEYLRVIADYIAGMTDEYATRFFERTFLPRHGTVFDKL